MDILLTVPTPFEIEPLHRHLTENFQSVSEAHFEKNGLHVHVLVTGVGTAFTACTIAMVLARQPFDLVINAGVAGAFSDDLKIGQVVNVVAERFGDLGVEEADGRFTDVLELGLIEENQPPFQNGWLNNSSAADYPFLPTCTGLTVNKVHGSRQSIDAIKQKYTADIETMEGAAFFLTCLLHGVPFLEIRAISNFVEPRNREAWNLPLAIDNLNHILVEILETFQS